MLPLALLSSHLRPRFAYILDQYGHARSRRRASARRGEAPCYHTGYICISSKLMTTLQAACGITMYSTGPLVRNRKYRLTQARFIILEISSAFHTTFSIITAPSRTSYFSAEMVGQIYHGLLSYKEDRYSYGMNSLSQFLSYGDTAVVQQYYNVINIIAVKRR